MFGPEKLPEVARKLGKYYKQLNEYKRVLDEEIKKGILEDTDNVFKDTDNIFKLSNVKKSSSTKKKKKKDLDDIKSIAVSLDIDPEGKSKEELLEEIKRKVKVNKSKEGEAESNE